MKHRLLVTRKLAEPAEAILRERYDVTTNRDDVPLSVDELRTAMAEFDALCPTLTDRIDARIIGAPNSRIRIIANYGAGYDHIDVEAARRAAIVVTNTPDVLTDATAEIAILLMLMATRRAGEGERVLRAGRWQGWAPTDLVGRGLAGRTLGLVGFGRIAQATARRARDGFGMAIAYHSRHRVADHDRGALRCDILPDAGGACRAGRYRLPALPRRSRHAPSRGRGVPATDEAGRGAGEHRARHRCG